MALTAQQVEAYRALDSHIKKMYFLNQKWFKVRDRLAGEELQKLFNILLTQDFFGGVDKMNAKLSEAMEKYGLVDYR